VPDKVTLDEQELMNKERRQLWLALTRIERWMEEPMGNGVQLDQVVTQAPQLTGSDWRAIIKGHDGVGQKWVAFAFGGSLPELHKNIARIGQERGFAWREDRPWPERHTKE
jgi:hypothetical protein